MNKRIEGFIAAPLTAFREDGSVDTTIIPSYARFLRFNGVSGVFVNGTTGEGFSLSTEERMAIAEKWVEASGGQFQVIIHVSHTSQVAAQDMAFHAAKIGADGIGEMGPLFFKPANVNALADQCALTASTAPGLPYYYYHMPAMSGVHFPMLDFLKAAETRIPSLAGIKYTYEDLYDFELCRAYKAGKYDILYGRDETLLCALALGCRGAVGSTFNIMAPLYGRLVASFDEGNLEEARRLQRISMHVIQRLIRGGNFFSTLKAVMGLLGVETGGVRAPLQNVDADALSGLSEDLSELGFWDVCSKSPNKVPSDLVDAI
jgi:N-acetylneuraminate lyase